MTNIDKKYSEKNMWWVLVIAIIFGMLGFHRFYIGKIGTGVVMILCTIVFFPISAVWLLIDILSIITGNMRDKDNLPISNVIF